MILFRGEKNVYSKLPLCWLCEHVSVSELYGSETGKVQKKKGKMMKSKGEMVTEKDKAGVKQNKNKWRADPS